MSELSHGHGPPAESTNLSPHLSDAYLNELKTHLLSGRYRLGAQGRPIAGSTIRAAIHAPPKPIDLFPAPGIVKGHAQGQGYGFDDVDLDPEGGDDDDSDRRGGRGQHDRDRDFRDGQSGKKRKVPSSLQTLGRDDVARMDDLEDGHEMVDCGMHGDGEHHYEDGHGYCDHDHDHDHDRDDDHADAVRQRTISSNSSRKSKGNNEAVYIDNGDLNDREDGEYRYNGIPVSSGTAAFPRKNGRWTACPPFISEAAHACAWRKALFLKRKAALITLFLDAQNAINQALKQSNDKPKVSDAKSKDTQKRIGNVTTSVSDRSSLILPEVAVFEQMMPALEDVGVGQWPLDQPGWRTGVEVTDETRVFLDRWNTAYEKRRRRNEGRKRVVRGGWAPEGSFEFEVNSKASVMARSRAKNEVALRKLIVELRAITLNATKITGTQKSIAQHTAQSNSNSLVKKSEGAISGQVESVVQTTGPKAAVSNDKESVPMSSNNSSQGSDNTAVGGGKKKTKKKKRSVLANQSNPHHVDNYRPGRMPGSHGDPLEPYPWHESLLFPPSMSFLSARPRSRQPASTTSAPASEKTDTLSIPEQAIALRPSEDDYICNFCEYALYYGTEAERKRAIRNRRRELKRKQTIKNRARNVAEGKGKGNLGREEDEEDWDDDGECEGGDGCGRCS